MNNRKLVRLIAVILAAVLALSLLVTVISYVALGASPESELERLRQEAETLRRKEEEAEARISDRYDRERASWLAILAEKDRELENANQMLNRLQKNYDIATKVLSVAKREEA